MHKHIQCPAKLSPTHYTTSGKFIIQIAQTVLDLIIVSVLR